MATPCCVHNGDYTRDCEFNYYLSYVLTLIEAYSILVYTHITWFYCPFYLSWGWVGRWKAPFEPKSFKIHPTNSQCVPLPMMGFEYIDSLPLIHKGPLRPSIGIMVHLVVSDLLIYSFSFKDTLRKILDPIKKGYLFISLVCSTIYLVIA